MHRELADWLGKHYDENEDTLTYLQRLYLCASGCLGVEIVVLLALALTKGKAS